MGFGFWVLGFGFMGQKQLENTLGFGFNGSSGLLGFGVLRTSGFWVLTHLGLGFGFGFMGFEVLKFWVLGYLGSMGLG